MPNMWGIAAILAPWINRMVVATYPSLTGGFRGCNGGYSQYPCHVTFIKGRKDKVEVSMEHMDGSPMPIMVFDDSTRIEVETDLTIRIVKDGERDYGLLLVDKADV